MACAAITQDKNIHPTHLEGLLSVKTFSTSVSISTSLEHPKHDDLGTELRNGHN